MAGYRQFHTKFWKDEYLIELDPLEKYLFMYLFTNDLSSISGLYKIPLKVIRNETDLGEDLIVRTLQKFQDDKRIFYRDGVMWVVNMAKYHSNASPKTKQKVSADVELIPDCDVKRAYLYFVETGIYSIDTLSIPHAYPIDTLSIPVVKAKEKAKAKTKEKAKEKEKASENEPEEHAPSSVQQMIESVIGYSPGNSADLKALEEITALNPTQDDIQEAYNWLTGQGKRVRYYSSLVGPVRTALAKRVQRPMSTPLERSKAAVLQVLEEFGVKNG